MHKIYRTLIVDDEEKARNNLKNVLKLIEDIEVVAEADNAVDALNVALKTHPDVIFLDIKMPQQDGFSFLDELSEHGITNVEVIFLTAYSEFAIRAIKCAAFDYLLKPVDPDVLFETMQRLRSESIKEIGPRLPALKEKLFQPLNKLRFNSANGFVFIHPEQIVYTEAEGSYCRIFLTDGSTQMVCRSMKSLEEQLAEYEFCRVHKSYLINCQYLSSYEKSRRIMHLTFPSGNAEVPVSVRLIKNFF